MKVNKEIENILRIQNYAKSAVEKNARYKKTIEAIVLRDLIWDGCIEFGAFGELNPATSQKMLSATLKQLAYNTMRMARVELIWMANANK